VQKKWLSENKLEQSAAFPPELIEKFASETAGDFIKWLSPIANHSTKKTPDIRQP